MEQKRLLTALTLALVLIFTLPSWVGMAALLSGQLSGKAGLGQVFFNLLFVESPIWDLAKTALVAMVAALAALGLGERLNLHAGVVTLTLLACFVPLLALALFMIVGQPASLWEDTTQTYPVGQDTFFRGWNAYLSSQAQVLAAQVALFLGLYKQTKP